MKLAIEKLIEGVKLPVGSPLAADIVHLRWHFIVRIEVSSSIVAWRKIRVLILLQPICHNEHRKFYNSLYGLTSYKASSHLVPDPDTELRKLLRSDVLVKDFKTYFCNTEGSSQLRPPRSSHSNRSNTFQSEATRWVIGNDMTLVPLECIGTHERREVYHVIRFVKSQC